MLSSIHPLGERARSNRWWLTVSAFVLGATAGGAALGAAAGAVGRLAGSAGWSDGARAAVVAVAAAGALLADVSPRRFSPVHRQVDERWLHSYRGWVYGVGYGAQLGVGLVTIVVTATLYLVVVLAALTGSIAAGAVVGATFGAVRGATLLAGRRLTSPDQLRRFHRRLDRARPAAAACTVATSAAVVAVAGLALVT
jgi:sulfite exporter TauE/SafE